MNTNELMIEIEKKKHVKDAADKAKIARDCLNQLKHMSYDVPEAEEAVNTALKCLDEIDYLLRNEFSSYRHDFYWINRRTNDCSLDLDVYEYATYVYSAIKKYDLALKCVSEGFDLADGEELEKFISLRKRIVKERDANLAKAAQNAARPDSLVATFSSWFKITRVLLVICSVFAIVYAFASNKAPLLNKITFVFLLLIGIMTALFSFLLRNEDAQDNEADIRPVILAPIGFFAYSLVIFFHHAYEDSWFLSFLIKHIGILAIAMVAGYFIGYLIDSIERYKS